MPNNLEQAYELTLVVRSQVGDEPAFAELFRKRGINGGVLTRVRANRKHGGNR